MGGCLSKRSSPEPVQEPVNNALREKQVLLVDLPPSRQSPSSSSVKNKEAQHSSSPKNVEAEQEKAQSPSPLSISSTEPLCRAEEHSPVTVQAPVEPPSPQPETISVDCAIETPLVTSTVEIVNAETVVEPVVHVGIATVKNEDVLTSAAAPCEPIIGSEEVTVAVSSTPDTDIPTGGEASTEEPAMKYSELDRIASFNLGHSHPPSTATRDSEHDIDRLKHFQKLGSATLVQGRHGPVMTGRGGKNRRSSTHHFPTETPITVSPRSAEI